MQLMPGTAARYGVPTDKKPHVGITQQQKLFDAQTNIGAGSRYLRDLLNLFNGKLDLALAAYNAGEGAVQRAGNKIPNYPETQNYVKTVMQMYAALKPPAPQPSPVLTPEPKKAVSPDPLRPIRGRGNGLPTSSNNSFVLLIAGISPSTQPTPLSLRDISPTAIGATKSYPLWHATTLGISCPYAIGEMSALADKGVCIEHESTYL
jgi:hypothetical protein